MEYQNYKKGLCDTCSGNVQVESSIYYCINCHKRWNENEWTALVRADKALDYQTNDYAENLNRLGDNKYWNYKPRD